jgi:hypothetical protein
MKLRSSSLLHSISPPPQSIEIHASQESLAGGTGLSVFRIQLGGNSYSGTITLDIWGSRWVSGKGEMEVQDILLCHRRFWKDFTSTPALFHAAAVYKSPKLCTCSTQVITSVDPSTRHCHYGHVSQPRLITWVTFCVRQAHGLNPQYDRMLDWKYVLES